MQSGTATPDAPQGAGLDTPSPFGTASAHLPDRFRLTPAARAHSSWSGKPRKQTRADERWGSSPKHACLQQAGSSGCSHGEDLSWCRSLLLASILHAQLSPSTSHLSENWSLLEEKLKSFAFCHSAQACAPTQAGITNCPLPFQAQKSP